MASLRFSVLRFCVVTIVSCCFLHSSNAIIGGKTAKKPPPDDPVVFVSLRGKHARISGLRDEHNYIFAGIRYAEPPLGLLRYQRPRTLILEGDLNATNLPPPCPQPRAGTKGNRTIDIIGDEDCLFLNIFTPELPDGSEGLPVVVWIHGGNFLHGSPSQYGAGPLVEKDLVVVTVQYRLGSLGFLSAGTRELPGNAALFDVQLALRWIRHYIIFFGGNPKNVITMGQGSGASISTLLSQSQFTKGFMHGVIAMSGNSLTNWTTNEKPAITMDMIAKEQGCLDKLLVDKIHCLQNLPYEKIVQGDFALIEKMKYSRNIETLTSLDLSGPVIEGRDDNRFLPNFLFETPLSSMKNKQFHKVPLLIGVTEHETAGAVLGDRYANFQQKLKTKRDYIEKEFISHLQTVSNTLRINQDVENIVNHTVGNLVQLSQNYLALADRTVNAGINKIIEVTGDVLFNLPAFMTSNFWAKSGTPVFMYSFEHKGNAPKGFNFLNDISLTRKSNDKDLVGHGDDLVYLFDPMPLEAANKRATLRSSDKLSKDDQAVRDLFTTIVSDFSHNVKSVSKIKFLDQFSEDKNNYLSIKLPAEKRIDFRFCQMGIWAGLEKRLLSPVCQFLSATNVEQVIPNLLNVPNPNKMIPLNFG